MEISDIKPHVTHFSEQLRFEGQHEQEVVVGGKILSVVQPVTQEHHDMYAVLIDDCLGTFIAYVTETLYQTFMNQFQVGNLIFLEGYLNVITRSIRKDIKREVSVLAYGVKDITTEEVFSS